MEVEFVGCESSKVRVLYKSFALRTVVILDEVRQSPMPEPKWDSFTFHVLLTHTGNDLDWNTNTEQFSNCTESNAWIVNKYRTAGNFRWVKFSLYQAL